VRIPFFSGRKIPDAAWIGWPLGLFLVALGYFASYAAYGDLIEDEGWQLHSTMRILAGEVQHRDFSSIYPFGRHYLFAGVLALFDESLLAFRMIFCVLNAVVVALVFAVARRLAPVGLALAAALVTLVVPGPWHKVFYTLVPLIGILLIIRWRETERRRWLGLAGLATGIGFWFRQDTGLFLIAASLALLGLIALSERAAGLARNARRAAVDAAWLLLPVAAVSIAVVGYFAFHGAAVAMLSQIFGAAVGEGAPKGWAMSQAIRMSIRDLGPITTHAVALLCWLPFLLALPVLVRSGIVAVHRRAIGPAEAGLFLLALSGLFAANQVFRFDVLFRFLQCGALIYPLWFAAGWLLISRAGDRRLVRYALGVATVALPLALVAMVLFARQSHRLPIEYGGTIATRFERSTPFEVRGTTFYFSPRRANELRRMLKFAHDNTAPGEPILVLGQPGALHYLADRPSPLPLIRVSNFVVNRLGRERIEQAVLNSGCRYLFTDKHFLGRGGSGWQGFLGRNCKRVGPIGKRFRVWEIR
jgi:hypothetical protein